jgi:hypothetical protein
VDIVIPLKRLLAGSFLMILSLVLVVTQTLAETGASAWQIEIVDQAGCWYPSLALDSAGSPHISYGAAGELKYARHDGSAWQPELVEDQPGATGWYSSLALDTLDAPHISYYSPYSSSLMYAHYITPSWQIETVGSAYNQGGKTALALDSANLPHIAYWDNTNRQVGYTHFDNVNWLFDPIATIPTGGQSVSLAIDLDSADRPHVCYYDYDTGMLKYVYHNGAAWSSETVDDDVFYNGQGCSIALDSQDRPHISYRDLGLMYARRSGSAWQTTVVDDDFFAGDGSSIALDSHDLPHISYNDWAVPEHDLRYAYFTGHSWWIEIVAVADEDRRIEDTSLALDDADLPHIGYWDLGTTDILKYAVRDTAPTFNRVYLPLVVRQLP